MTDLAPAAPYDHAASVELDDVPLAVVRHEGVTLDEVAAKTEANYTVSQSLKAAA